MGLRYVADGFTEAIKQSSQHCIWFLAFRVALIIISEPRPHGLPDGLVLLRRVCHGL